MTDDSDERGRLARTTSAATFAGKKLALLWIVPGHFLKVMLRQSIVATTRVMPFIGRSFWRGMIKWAVWQYQRAAGADVVNISAEPHGLEPRAANYVESDAEKPDQQPGWREVGGTKTWGPGANGRSGVERFGKADVILSDRAAHETATPLTLRYDEALDLEQVEPLVAPATVEQTVVDVWPNEPLDDPNARSQALADGGQAERTYGSFAVDASEAMPDALVDLASGFGDGRGMQVSARKYKDEKLSSADAEAIDKAETRGKLAGMMGGQTDKVMKVVFWCLLTIGAIMFAIFGIPVIFGNGGGGGGGSVLPFLLLLWGSVKP